MSISSALSSPSYTGKRNQTKQITQEMLFIRLLPEQGGKAGGIPLPVPGSYTALREEEGAVLSSAQLPLRDRGARLVASAWYFSQGGTYMGARAHERKARRAVRKRRRLCRPVPLGRYRACRAPMAGNGSARDSGRVLCQPAPAPLSGPRLQRQHGECPASAWEAGPPHEHGIIPVQKKLFHTCPQTNCPSHC